MTAHERPTDEQLLLAAQPAIGRTARRIKRGPLFARELREDVESELRLELIIRLPRFDHRRARFGAFLSYVLRTAAVDLVRRRLRDRRRIEGSTFPVSNHRALIDPDSGCPRELSDADGARRLGRADSDTDRWSVADAMAQLPEDLRDVARRLSRSAPTKVARDLGITRRQLRNLRARLATEFRARGLDPFS